ncbi:hypothetical protein ACTFQF_00680 [Aliivibrio fischeri]|uniref:Uncharacterized protein n=1 Tax=Aliivibrio fischeri (strain MJ11) TaxID=388396 RepID=B5EWB0_ALIFM|nr:hypothetical protein [Aliivibrio fischeri]ACH64731.1 conserved hypothetical protein [Aliivibrio fischeri MJ11]MUK37569.1 hypothetical protein [Aliivibrio fischeri]
MINNKAKTKLIYGQEPSHFTYEVSERGGFNVYGWGIYPSYSVLAGQDCKTFFDYFKTIEEVSEHYPDATSSHKLLEPQNTFDHLPNTQDF